MNLTKKHYVNIMAMVWNQTDTDNKKFLNCKIKALCFRRSASKMMRDSKQHNGNGGAKKPGRLSRVAYGLIMMFF